MGNTECKTVVRLTADTTLFPYNGPNQIKILAYTSPLTTPAPSNYMAAVAGAFSQAVLNNPGKPLPPGEVQPTVTVGYGQLVLPWDYANVRLRSALPTAAVSGSMVVDFTTMGQIPGLPGITGSFVSIDPAFHASPVDKGNVILDQAGGFDGKLTINTASLDASKPHKLFIRSDQLVSSGSLVGTNSAALIIIFTV